jgi:hypothetical protein
MVGKEGSPKLINMDHNSLAGVSEDSPDTDGGGRGGWRKGSLSKMFCQRRLEESVLGSEADW